MRNKIRKMPLSISIPIILIDDLDKLKEKEDVNMSDLVVRLIKKGIELETLLEINRNPEKKKEFEDNLKQLLSQESFEKTLETMDDMTLDAILSYASLLKDKRFKQDLLAIR